MIFAGFVDLFVLLLEGDRVAWIWLGALVLLILPVLFVWWRVARMFKREEEEKKRKRGGKKFTGTGAANEGPRCDQAD